MSAFFIIINRNREPLAKSVAGLMMAQLDRFGRDSKNLIIGDYYALGYQSHWTVPEEEGEQQPLFLADQQLFAFYGRLDNRLELLQKLEMPTNAKLSDAALAQAYFAAYGVNGLPNLVGPFALLHFNAADGALMLARDGMGARSISYKVDNDYILAATNEMALAAHPSVGYYLNDCTVARHITNQMQPGPSSMIRGLTVLGPGYILEVDNSRCETQRFYAPDPAHRIILDTDHEYACEFKRLLTQAVRRRARCIGNIGTQLSGGMDSVPVTIAAAHIVEHCNLSKEGSVLSAYSWVFERYKEADERQYSAPLSQTLGIEQVMVVCDDRWLSYDANTPVDPLGPIYNPFMAYNQALFEQARLRSVKVMLNGIHGDILYGYTQGVLYELCKSGEFKDAFVEAFKLLREVGSIKRFVKDYILKPLPWVKRIVNRMSARRNLHSDTLQPHIIDQLNNQTYQMNHLQLESHKALRPQQWQVVLGDFAGSDAATGRFLESEYGIERRYPFRDRDLVEFMLAIPSKQLAFDSVKRPIVKRAFEADFSDEFKKRNTKAYFADVTLNSLLADKENAQWATSGVREWQYYVKECYFDSKVQHNRLVNVVKWRCGYYDYWKSVCYHPIVEKLGLGNESPKENK